jgi:hypothetical protein
MVPESPDYTLCNQPGMPQYSDHQNSLIGDDQVAEVFTQYNNGDLVYVNQAFKVVGEDMDTTGGE